MIKKILSNENIYILNSNFDYVNEDNLSKDTKIYF